MSSWEGEIPSRIDRWVVAVCEAKKCHMAATRKWTMRNDITWMWCTKHEEEYSAPYWEHVAREREEFLVFLAEDKHKREAAAGAQIVKAT